MKEAGARCKKSTNTSTEIGNQMLREQILLEYRNKEETKSFTYVKGTIQAEFIETNMLMFLFNIMMSVDLPAIVLESVQFMLFIMFGVVIYLGYTNSNRNKMSKFPLFQASQTYRNSAL